MVIGIEGKPGSGKSYLASKLLCEIPNAIHLEESNLLLQIVDIAIYLRNKGLKDQDIVEEINNLNISYQIIEQKVEFIIDYNYEKSNLSDLDKKLFAYNNKELKNSIIKSIYKNLYECIDNLKNNYNLIITGRELKFIYPNMIHFTLEVNEETRRMRQIKRDTDEVGVNIRENADKEFFVKTTDSIVIDTSNLKIEDIITIIKDNL